MINRHSREPPPRRAEPAPFAAKATDLGALRDAVVDAAGVGAGLWFSYLFGLFYFAIAAGAVTHRDLLLENLVKLPFLNVELPLKAFFILGPLVFLIVHAYVLLHFVLLAGKVGAFQSELLWQIKADETRAHLRRQLPSNIFVQFIAGPREVREGTIGFLLRQVAQISLVAGPIALLVLFQLQFLPSHNEWISSWQRVAVLIDLILLWFLWPPIARGETALLGWNDFKRVKVLAWLLASILPVLLVFSIATFPGEWLEENLPSLSLIPTEWPPCKAAPPQAEHSLKKPQKRWTSLHELLVAGDVNYVTGRTKSLWSNVLVLPNFEVGDRVKFDAEGKIAITSDRLSLRGRSLEGAILVSAYLRKADFTGAQLTGANFSFADLREAEFQCDRLSSEKKCAQLQGASLMSAQLQGASLDDAQLQGVSLRAVRLQAASLSHVFVWRTNLSSNIKGALVDAPETGPKYRALDCPAGECDWSEKSYAALKSLIENSVPMGFGRDQALRQIATLEKPPFVQDEASARGWAYPAEAFSQWRKHYPETLAKTLEEFGCAADGTPYVIGGLIRRLDERFGVVQFGDLRDLFPDGRQREAEVARAFLDEATCPGARGLSEENKAKLQKIRDRAPAPSGAAE
jgi:hypothetical protein